MRKNKAIIFLILFFVLSLPVLMIWSYKTYNYIILTHSIKEALNKQLDILCNNEFNVQKVRIKRELYYFNDMGLESIIYLDNNKELRYISELDDQGNARIYYPLNLMCKSHLNENLLMGYNFEKRELFFYESEQHFWDLTNESSQIDLDVFTWHPLIKSFIVIYEIVIIVICFIISIVWANGRKKQMKRSDGEQE